MFKNFNLNWSFISLSELVILNSPIKHILSIDGKVVSNRIYSSFIKYVFVYKNVNYKTIINYSECVKVLQFVNIYDLWKRFLSSHANMTLSVIKRSQFEINTENFLVHNKLPPGALA